MSKNININEVDEFVSLVVGGMTTIVGKSQKHEITTSISSEYVRLILDTPKVDEILIHNLDDQITINGESFSGDKEGLSVALAKVLISEVAFGYNLEDVDIEENYLDVNNYDHDKYFNIKAEGDYSVSLPDLGDVDKKFIFKFKNLKNTFAKGTFSALVGQQIEGSESFVLDGKGFISVRKKTTEGVASWSVTDFANLEHGRTKQIDFSNHSGVFRVDHALGHRPIVEVELEDEEGFFSTVEIDVDHSAENDFFIVNLIGTNTGFIKYV